jgi:hypothetical protein
MAVYVATYDLHKPDRDYEPLYVYLKQFAYAHCIGSVWLIETTLTAAQLRDGMLANMHEKDTILVMRLQYDGAWHNYVECGKWILDSERKW